MPRNGFDTRCFHIELCGPTNQASKFLNYIPLDNLRRGSDITGLALISVGRLMRGLRCELNNADYNFTLFFANKVKANPNESKVKSTRC